MMHFRTTPTQSYSQPYHDLFAHLARSSIRFFSLSSFSFFFLSALRRASLLRSLASFLDFVSALCLLSSSLKCSRGCTPSGILLRWVTNSFQWLNKTRNTVIWKTKRTIHLCDREEVCISKVSFLWENLRPVWTILADVKPYARTFSFEQGKNEWIRKIQWASLKTR